MAIKIRDGGAWVDVGGGGSGSGSGPIGSIIYYPSSSPPDGYLKANGASLNTSTYSDLFSIFGYTFGGSGSSFNLPDLRGEFIRGWDDGRGVDGDRTFGSFQNFQVEFHSHTHQYALYPSEGGAEQDQTGGSDGPRTNFNATRQTSTTGTNGNYGGETRPRNVALLACIKYQ